MKKVILTMCLTTATILLMGAFAQATTVTYYACVANLTGVPVIVPATTTCLPGFTKISWNQQGPAGATRATGATGAAGPTENAELVQNPLFPFGLKPMI